MALRLRFAVGLPVVISLLGNSPLRAAAIPEETINRAVERAVTALRKAQAADGSFVGTTYGSGPTSLAALTLLECGAGPADEQVRKAVAFVRSECPSMKSTYHLALAIILLDRFDDPLDEPIIHRLTVRLLEGQAPIGGWGYASAEVPADEAAKVRTLIERRTELKTAPDGSKATTRPPVDAEDIERLKRLEKRQPQTQPVAQVDNSNTQFAVLGAWIGRRHGIPTDAALRRTEAYFRATQVGGRWGYRPVEEDDTRVANTCSGLLGLAVGAGIVREVQMRAGAERKEGKPPTLRDPLKDVLVQAAMNYVGSQVAELAATGLNADVNINRNLYFLWSIERVGMIYSVPVMGGVDWYQVGAGAILRAQQPDGMWQPRTMGSVTMTPEINTCFAVLFLRRANFAHDLTANLRNKSRQTTIRSGGDKGEPLPDPAAISEAERLARELPTAPANQQDAILAQLRDGKGTEFTEALSHVIPKLSGDVQKRARDALAERIARMNAATVRSKLKDADGEVRRASALACAMKDDKGFIPDLIAVLEDKEVWVIRAAAVALRTLTGQDFGPSATATVEERAKSIAAWKAWWKRQNSR